MSWLKWLFVFFAVVSALGYAFILFLDSRGRKEKSEESGDDSGEGAASGGRTGTSIVYPPGFGFLEEAEEHSDPPSNLDGEVQKLVRTFEDQTTEVYRRFHRLLKYSDTVTRSEEELQETKLRLENEMERLAEENSRLKETADNQMIFIRELEGKLETLQHTCNTTSSELEQARQGFRKETDSLTAACGDLENKVREYEEKMESLKKENEQLGALQEESERSLSEAREEIERLSDVEQSCTGLSQEAEALRSRCAELEQAAEQAAEEQNAEPVSQQSEAVSKTLYKENKELSEQVERDRQELEALRSELEELQEFRDRKDTAEREIEQSVQAQTALLEQEVFRLKAELEEARSAQSEAALYQHMPEADVQESEEVSRLQKEIIKRDNTVAQLNEVIRDLKKQTTSVSQEREDEVAFLHGEIARKDAEIEKEKTAAAGLQQEIQGIKQALEEKEGRNRELQQEKSGLEERIQNLLGSEDNLQIEMGSLEDTIAQKEQRISELEELVQSLEKKQADTVKHHEDQIAFLEHELNRYNMQELDTEKEKEDYNRKITDKESRIRELQTQIDGFEQERAEWQRESDFLREKIADLENVLGEKTGDGRELEELQQENEAYAGKVLQLNEEMISRDRLIEQLKQDAERNQAAAENLREVLDGIRLSEEEHVSHVTDETARREEELADYRNLINEKESENSSLREKLVSAEDLIQDLKRRISLLEDEVRERTISEKEHITCSKCCSDIPPDDISLKKAQRIEGKIYCKFCLEEMEHEARSLVIEDRLEKIASLVSQLRLREDWDEYREIDICEELVRLGKKHAEVIARIREDEDDEYVRDILKKVVDMILAGESPRDVMIDDDLERTAYLLQKLRKFPGRPDEGRGREVCRELVSMGPSIDILLRGIISQEKDDNVRDALARVRTAIENQCTFDEVT